MAEMDNPLYKHYDGKFEKQEQPYPGVQNKMHPVPDCGEESYVASGQLTDRKALVTGGDSGIAISYLPDEESDAREVKSVIEEAGQKAVLLPGDLRDEEFARNLVHEAAEKLGGLDILVLNAAIQQFEKDIRNLSTNQLTDTFTVNIFSNVWMLQEALDHLPEGGSVIVTTSVQAFNPSGHLSDYAMTKSAQVTFVIAMTAQLAEKGIRINAVSPGPVWTVLQVAGGQAQENIPEFGQKEPLKRAGQPVELASTYVLLASNSASFTTGQVYGVTGGTSIN